MKPMYRANSVSACLDRELHARVHRAVAQLETNPSALVREAIREYLDRLEAEGGRRQERTERFGNRGQHPATPHRS